MLSPLAPLSILRYRMGKKQTDFDNNMHSERNGCWVSQDELILLDQAALYKADFVCFPPHHSLKNFPCPFGSIPKSCAVDIT